MNRYLIYKKLGLEPRGLLISNLHVIAWGKEVTVDAFYDPDQRQPFKLIFKGCSSLSWTVLEFEYDISGEIEADVISLFLDEHQQPHLAVVHTDLFELRVNYSELAIQTPDQEQGSK